MFGDNESVVNSSKNLYSKLTKHHNALSYHRVCEAIASGFVKFSYIPGKINPVDILSKYWNYSDVKIYYSQFFTSKEIPSSDS